MYLVSTRSSRNGQKLAVNWFAKVMGGDGQLSVYKLIMNVSRGEKNPQSIEESFSRARTPSFLIDETSPVARG